MGDNPNAINPASLLELESTSKGFLWPRMTTSQRDAISQPPTGLTIFNTDNVCVEVNVGTPDIPSWLCLSNDNDNQALTFFELNGEELTISIEGGNTQTVSLTGLGEDNQNISDLRLNGTILTISLEDGNTRTLDLSTINSDDQLITSFELVGSVINIEIEDGNSRSIDLSDYPGIMGPEGPEGPMGIGIDRIENNGDGTITIIYTDGNSFDTPDFTGPQGPIGVDGAQGPAGVDGAQGPAGIDGVQGAAGVDGIGIVNTLNNNNGTYTFVYSDGSSFTTDDLTGDEGNGIVNTIDNGDGTFTIVYSNGDTYTTADFTGPQGPTGVNGIQGAQGADGQDGVDGVGVSNTVDNNDGTFTINYTDGTSYTSVDLSGPQGPAGTNGGDGTNGVDGTDGIDGRGIARIDDNLDGTFTYVYTDGTTFTTIDLTGPTGNGIDRTIDNGNGTLTIYYTNGDSLLTSDFTGPQGVAGTDGLQGPAGANGIAGVSGEDGRGIARVDDNLDGTFTYVYTDGSTFTTIDLTGPTGNGIDRSIDNGDGTLTIYYTNGDTLLTSDFTGPQGPTGSQGIQGPAGSTGADGADGANGVDGVDGIGIARVEDNLDGTFTYVYTDSTTFTTIDLTGPTGNGIDRSIDNGDGTLTIYYTNGDTLLTSDFTGPQGPTGSQGIQGPAGSAGADGANGVDGVDGIGIARVEDNLDGTFTYVYTDSTTFTTIDLTGPTGNGIDRSIDNGDGTLTIYYTNGDTLLTSDFTGPQGPAGSQGIQGPAGSAGADGANGANGANGVDGIGIARVEDNSDGTFTYVYTDSTTFTTIDLTGPTGNGIDRSIDNGDGTLTIYYTNGDTLLTSDFTGPQGPTGSQGIQGPAGSAGADGADGANGVDGVDGIGIARVEDNLDGTFTYVYTDSTTFTTIDLTGPTGNGIDRSIDNGDGTLTIYYTNGDTLLTSDFTGPQGPTGSQGIQGPAGSAGADGADGANGVDGVDGIGIARVEDNLDGTFTYVYTDSTTFTTIDLTGPTGNGIDRSIDNGDGTLTIYYTNGDTLLTSDFTGPQGPGGPQGIQGPAGSAGADGADGANGVDGVDGIGIARVEDNLDGTFTYVYTDSTTFTTIDLTGPTGNGIDRSIDNGDGTLTIYYTNGDTLLTSDFTGPQGPGGPQGIQGPAGDPATDDQVLSLSNDTLYIDNGNFVVLDKFLDDRDSQQITQFQFDTLTNLVYIALEDGGQDTVDLSKLNASGSDDQLLSLSNDTLYLEDGGFVALDQVIDSFETLTFVRTQGDTSIIYTDEDGVETEIDIRELETTTTLSGPQDSLVYTNEDGDETIFDGTDDQQITQFQFDTLTNLVYIALEDGGQDTVDLSKLNASGSDDQLLSLSNDTLYLEDGGFVALDQVIDSFETLTFVRTQGDTSIIYTDENGQETEVDIQTLETTTTLSGPQDSLVYTNEDGDETIFDGTDDQQITQFQFDTLTNLVYIALEDGGQDTVDLSKLNASGSDDQLLSLSNDTLYLEDGGFVALDQVIDSFETLTFVRTQGDTSIIYTDENGQETEVDIQTLETTTTLSGPQDSLVYTNEDGDETIFDGTDDQQITQFQFDTLTNLVYIALEDGGQDTIDLSNLNASGSDDQLLTLSNDTLYLEDGGFVALDQVIDSFETLTFVRTQGDTSIIYTDEDGVETEIDIRELETTTTLSGPQDSLVYMNEDGDETIFDGTDDQQITQFQFDTLTNLVYIALEDGGQDTIDLSNLNASGSDDQLLTLSNDTLYLEDGGFVALDQVIDSFETLTFVRTQGDTSIIYTDENGQETEVDIQTLETTTTLSGPQDSLVYTNEDGDETIFDGTDDQQIERFELDTINNLIFLSLEDGGMDTIDLAYLNNDGSDDQLLTLSNDTLYLEDGGYVALDQVIDSFETLTFVRTQGDTSIIYTDENGQETEVDIQTLETTTTLNGPQDSLVYTNEDGDETIFDGTDDQQIERFELDTINNLIFLSLEDGGMDTIDLAYLNDAGSDDQQIENFTIDTVSNIMRIQLEDGGVDSLDLSYLNNDGSDDQMISISNDTIYLEDGGFVILSPMVDSFETLTTIDTSGSQIIYVDENRDTSFIDIAELESNTTIEDTLTGNRIATYINEDGDRFGVYETITTISNTRPGNRIAVYTNEDSIQVPINETITSLDTTGSAIVFEREDGGFDTVDVADLETITDISLTQSAGKDIGVYTNENGLQDTIRETITSIDTAGSTIIYYNEDGSNDTIDVGLLETLTFVTIDSSNGHVTYSDERGDLTVIDMNYLIDSFETTTDLVQANDSLIIFTNEDGGQDTVNVRDLETITDISLTQSAGKDIGVYTNENGLQDTIRETITSIDTAGSTIIYYNEDGSNDTIDVGLLETLTFVTIDSSNGHVTYSDERGDLTVIDMNYLIDSFETTTDLVQANDSLIIFTNEDGGQDTVNVRDLETITDISLTQPAGKDIGVYTNENGLQDTIRETITSIDTAGSTIIYYNEDGSNDTIDVGLLETLTFVTIDSSNGHVTYSDERGDLTVIDMNYLIDSFETTTDLVQANDSLIIFTNEDGGQDTVNVRDLETITDISLTQSAGKDIGVYTNENGLQDTIRETITSIDTAGSTIIYYNEDGSNDTIDVGLLETLTFVTIDSSNGHVTYSDERGDLTVIDMNYLIDSFETTTDLVQANDSLIIFTNEDGGQDTVNVRDLETITDISLTQSAGKDIGVYTNENGLQDTIRETITSIDTAGSTIIYYNEDGSNDTIDVALLETLTFVTIDSSTGIVTYSDEIGGLTEIDMDYLIDSFETTTDLVQANDSLIIFTNEDGGQDTVNVRDLETITDISLTQSAGKDIGVYTNENGLQDTIRETITSIDTAGSTIIYYNEDGSNDTIDVALLETLTFVTIDSSTGIVTYSDEIGGLTEIDMDYLIDSFETTTDLVQANDSLIIFTNEDGGQDTVNVRDLETITDISLTQSAGKDIGVYTNENGLQDTIRETITSIDTAGSTIIYYNEDGSNDTIDVALLETLTFVTIDSSTGIVTYSDEIGGLTEIDMDYLIDSFETTTDLVQANDSLIIFTNEDGGQDTVNVRDLETITDISLTQSAGKDIGVYTNENGLQDTIRETITSIDTAGSTIIYYNEDGSNDTIDVALLETLTFVTIDSSTGIVTYSDEIGGLTEIDMDYLIDSFETTTDLVQANDSLIIFTNEDGGKDTVNVRDLETITEISLTQSAGKDIGVYTNENGLQDTIRETITSIDTAGSTIIYYNEDGSNDTIDVGLLETLTFVTIDSSNGHVTYSDERGDLTVIDMNYLIDSFETTTDLVQANDSLIIFTNEDGGQDTVNVRDLETITDISLTQSAGKDIGVYTNENGLQDTIRETITSIDTAGSTIIYYNEDGSNDTIDVGLLETLTFVTIDSSNGHVTYSDERGDLTVIDMNYLIDSFETTTDLVQANDSLIIFTNEDGGQDTVNVRDLETITSIGLTQDWGEVIGVYENENGELDTIYESLTTISGDANEIVYLREDGERDTIDISTTDVVTTVQDTLTDNGHEIATYTNEEGDDFGIYETITGVREQTDSTFVFYQEDGDSSIVNIKNLETLTTISIDTLAGTITYIDEDSEVQVLDLRGLVREHETLTTIEILPGDSSFVYVDEDGGLDTVSIKDLETITSVDAIVTDLAIATYTNENDVTDTIYESLTTISGDANEIVYLREDGERDTIDISTTDVVTTVQDTLTDNGHEIATYTNEEGDDFGIYETITGVREQTDSTFVFYQEDGDSSIVNIKNLETLTTISIDTLAGTITYIDEDSEVQVLDLRGLVREHETLTTIEILPGDSSFVYVDEDGGLDTVNIKDLETITSVDAIATDLAIATYTNENDVTDTIYESLTTISGDANEIVYLREDGERDTIDISTTDVVTTVQDTLTDNGHEIATYTNEEGDDFGIYETITGVREQTDSTFVFYQEDGDSSIVNIKNLETLTTISIDTLAGTITYIDEDSEVQVLDLRGLVREHETLTTIEILPGDSSFVYVDEDGGLDTVNIKDLETITSVDAIATDLAIATYTNENDVTDTIYESLTTISGDAMEIVYLREDGERDTIDISTTDVVTTVQDTLTDNGHEIATYTNEEGDDFGIYETITGVREQTDSTFVFYQEDGDSSIVNIKNLETLTTISIDTLAGTITYIDEDSEVQVLDLRGLVREHETLTTIEILPGDSSFVYVDEDGGLDTVNIKDLETITSVDAIATDLAIATYTNENDVTDTIYESLTTLSGDAMEIVYLREDGERDTIDISTSDVVTTVQDTITDNGHEIATYTNEEGDDYGIYETITGVREQTDSTFVFYQEDGDSSIVNIKNLETLTTISIDTLAGTITYIDEDSEVQVLDLRGLVREHETLTTIEILPGDSSFVYVDEDGGLDTVNIKDLETITSVDAIATDLAIATYTNENDVTDTIYESLTTISGDANEIVYLREDGERDTIDISTTDVVTTVQDTLTDNGHEIATYTNEEGDDYGIYETITGVREQTDSTFVFYQEDGDSSIVNIKNLETLTTISIDTLAGTITYIDEDSEVQVLDLRGLVREHETLTTIEILPGDSSFVYVDEDGGLDTVNIKDLETITSVDAIVTDLAIATYTNENDVTDTIYESLTTISGDAMEIVYLREDGERDTIDISTTDVVTTVQDTLTDNGHEIATYTNEEGDDYGIYETITGVREQTDSTFVFYQEDGDSSIVNIKNLETLTTISIDTLAGTITYIDEDSEVQVLDLRGLVREHETLTTIEILPGDSSFVYVDEDGGLDTVNIKDLETITSVDAIATDLAIATYTNENDVTDTIYESLTTLSGDANEIVYLREDGERDTIDISTSDVVTTVQDTLTDNGHEIATYTNEEGDDYGIYETITGVREQTDSTFVFYQEDGDSSIVNIKNLETLTTISIDTLAGTITYIDEDSEVQVLDLRGLVREHETLTTIEILPGDSSFVYVDEDGGLDTVNIKDLETITSVDAIATDLAIATYTNENDVTDTIYESLTTLSGDANEIVYWREDGERDTIDISTSDVVTTVQDTITDNGHEIATYTNEEGDDYGIYETITGVREQTDSTFVFYQEDGDSSIVNIKNLETLTTISIDTLAGTITYIDEDSEVQVLDLRGLVREHETLTTIEILPGDSSFVYVDEDGGLDTVNIKDLETITSVDAIAIDLAIATYTNENDVTDTIYESLTTLSGDAMEIVYLREDGERDTIDISTSDVVTTVQDTITDNGHEIATYTNEEGDDYGIYETITGVREQTDSTFVFYQEDGDSSIVNIKNLETLTTISIDTLAGTITYIDEDSEVQVLDLRGLVREHETLTTIEILPGDSSFVYVDEDGGLDTVNIKDLETITSVDAIATDLAIATYTNENDVTDTIYESLTTLSGDANEIVYLREDGERDTIDISTSDVVTTVQDTLTDNGHEIATYTNEEGDDFGIYETITGVREQTDSTFVFYQEDGDSSIVNIKNLETLTTISIDTLAGTITYIDEDSEVQVLDLRGLVREHETLTTIEILPGDSSFVYVDEDGGLDTVNIKDLETITSVDAIATDLAIATYTNENDVTDTIYESLTTLSGDANEIVYLREDGERDTIDISTSDVVTTVQDTITDNGHEIATYTNEEGDDFGIYETITGVREQTDSTFVFYQEDGDSSIVNIKNLETLTTISIDTLAGTITYIDEDSEVQVLDLRGLVREHETLTTIEILPGDSSFVYVDEDGGLDTVNIKDLETITSVDAIATDLAIATYTNENDVTDTIYESLTTLSGDANEIVYLREDGERDTIDISTSDVVTTVQDTITDNGHEIATYTNEEGDDFGIYETITGVREQTDSTFVFYQEDGDSSIVNIKNLETLTTISIDTLAGTITYIDEDSQPQVLNLQGLVREHETVTTITGSTNNLTYTSEDGSTDTFDGTDDQQIQDFTFNDASNEVYIEIQDGGRDTIDLSALNNAGSDDQQLNTTVITANELVEVGLEDGDTISIDIRDADSDITNEIQDLSLVGNDLTITNNGSATTVDLSPYLDNTDTQDITQFDFNAATNEVYIALQDGGQDTIDLSALNNAGSDDQQLNTTVITANELVEVGLEDGDTISIDIRDADSDITNEIQDLSLVGNDLTITNNGSATTVDLSPYLDNTDTQDITQFDFNAATNEVYIALQDGGQDTIDLSALNNAGSDDQQLNTTVITANELVEVGLEDGDTISIDIRDADSDITNEIQDLSLVGNDLTITNNGSATTVDLSPYLDNTDTQDITQFDFNAATNEVYIALQDGGQDTIDLSALNNAGSDDQQLNTTVITANELVEVGLEDGDTISIDIRDADSDITNEIQDLSLVGNDLTITNNGSATTVDLGPYLDNTDTQDITQFDFNAATNEVYIALQDGGQDTIDLSALNNTDTDEQNVTDLSIVDDSLSITIERGNTQKVDLSGIFNSSMAEIYYAAGSPTQALGTSFADIDFGTDGIVDPEFTTATDGITVNVTGRYRVTYRITTMLANNTRSGAEFRLELNGTPVAGTTSATYQRNNDVNRSTATVTKVIQIIAGQKLTVQGERYSATGNIEIYADGSSLLVERIR